MKCTLNPLGSICMIVSTDEAEVISHALRGREIRLRALSEKSPSLDKTLAMLPALDKAIEQAHTAMFQLKEAVLPAPRKHSERTGLWQRVYDYFNPSLDISQVEAAAGKFGGEVFLTDMRFCPNIKGRPYHIAGKIRRDGLWIPASWSAHGQCSCPRLGDDEFLYDLHPADERIVHAGTIFGYALCAILLSAAIWATISYLSK